MRLRLALISASVALLLSASVWAQSLAPRAYAITPLDANAGTLTWAFYTGGLTYNVPILSVYHSFNFFGRSANVLASLPYAVGNFTGEVGNQQRSIYRSGLL